MYTKVSRPRTVELHVVNVKVHQDRLWHDVSDSVLVTMMMIMR